MSNKQSSIVHLFEDFSRITEVLVEGFVPNYHAEDLRLSIDPTDVMHIGIPMVSFTDIGDIDLFEFIKNAHPDYGKYAIQMKKKWALRQKWMNPVLYITDDDMLYNLNKNWKSAMEIGIAGYCKKYQSEWKGHPHNNYNEREWRYTVPITEVKWILTKEAYDAWRNYPVLKNRPLPTEELRIHTLKFDIDDIEGIIVTNKEEFEEINRFFHSIEFFSGERRNLTSSEMYRLSDLVKVNA